MTAIDMPPFTSDVWYQWLSAYLGMDDAQYARLSDDGRGAVEELARSWRVLDADGFDALAKELGPRIWG